MEQLRIPANIEQLGAVMEFVDEVLERGDCPLEIRTLIDVAVEEIFVNIASYAYTSDKGVTMELSNVSPTVYSILESVGFAQILTIK